MTTEQRKTIAAEAKIPFCNVAAFRNPANAKSYLRHTVKMNMMMRVKNEYWIVSPAEAQRLNKLGYEYANI